MPTVNREPIKVAVIEDTPALGKLVRKIVDAMDGIETFGVWENAEDGLKAIENGGPDVILMDISLPGMSGIEATIKVKETNPGIDVIMLTVHDDDQKIFDALQAGASGYLLKNASPDDLCRAIFEVRTGGAPMSAEIARLVVEAFHRPASSEASQAFNLSKRETEIVQLVARGLANKEIAAELSISVETVRVHLKHIYEKLHVRSRTEAAMKYRDSLERAPWNKQ
ncbi:MAG: response regulator transcription factor [Roseibacillus sp.]|nr:response regulator transcription factor [Roseibacillus sp.]